ncbi:hypothetical protein JCM10207_004181 [Rhodosporidiobolus poonsookiae]
MAFNHLVGLLGRLSSHDTEDLNALPVPLQHDCAQDRQSSPHRIVLVQGEKGHIEVAFGTYRPDSLTYYAWESADDYGAEQEPRERETVSFTRRPGGIWGFAGEADEVARCLRDGKTESDRMPLRETILQMQVFDEIREQGDFRYPDELEMLEVG